MRLHRACSFLALTAALLLSVTAKAGGLYFSDRGVRPMGRGGAFVAGADDLGAIWYNPAGIADAGNTLLGDFSWLAVHTTYDRQLRIVTADNVVTYVNSPRVNGSSPFIPFPTLAGAVTLDDNRRFTLAGGVLAPYIAIPSYPDEVAGEPSPARYTLKSFQDSAIAMPGVWASYRPVPEASFGLGLLALAGFVQTTTTFSVSPQDRLLGAPEQPDFDAQSQLRVGPFVAPALSVGTILAPVRWLRLGLSFQTPMIISADATLKVRLPSGAAFDSARVRGNEAHVRFTLPAIARFGVEIRPTPRLRTELALVREFWSAHDRIEATSGSIFIDGIIGAPPSVPLPTITIPRNFVDSTSWRLGTEMELYRKTIQVDGRAGLTFETSAVPPAYVSLTSMDFEKVFASLGGSLHVGEHWRLDASYSYLLSFGQGFGAVTRVSADEAQVPRINPLKGNAPLEAINGGTYRAFGSLLGLGARYQF